MPSKYPAHPVAIGQTFHYLTVVAKYRFGLWVCRCRCGRETKVAGAKLVSGHSKSSRCGCWRKDHPPEPAIKDKLGQRYGRLTVVKYVGIKKHQAFWLCQCDCGNTAEIISGALREGGTKSCGCMVLDLGKYPGHQVSRTPSMASQEPTRLRIGCITRLVSHLSESRRKTRLTLHAVVRRIRGFNSAGLPLLRNAPEAML
jgi:hypothetical protein